MAKCLPIWINRRLTFDMSGGLPTAQPAVRRPLDGGVRHGGAQTATAQAQLRLHRTRPPKRAHPSLVRAAVALGKPWQHRLLPPEQRQTRCVGYRFLALRGV